MVLIILSVLGISLAGAIGFKRFLWAQQQLDILSASIKAYRRQYNAILQLASDHFNSTNPNREAGIQIAHKILTRVEAELSTLEALLDKRLIPWCSGSLTNRIQRLQGAAQRPAWELELEASLNALFVSLKTVEIQRQKASFPRGTRLQASSVAAELFVSRVGSGMYGFDAKGKGILVSTFGTAPEVKSEVATSGIFSLLFGEVKGHKPFA